MGFPKQRHATTSQPQSRYMADLLSASMFAIAAPLAFISWFAKHLLANIFVLNLKAIADAPGYHRGDSTRTLVETKGPPHAQLIWRRQALICYHQKINQVRHACVYICCGTHQRKTDTCVDGYCMSTHLHSRING